MSATERMSERALWRQVVAQAAEDALGKTKSNLRYATEARAWFCEGGQDFRDVCERADLDADHLQRTMLAMVDTLPEAPAPVRAMPGSEPRHYVFNGMARSLSDWAPRLGIRESTLRHRLAKGMTIEEAFTTPCAPRRRTQASKGPGAADQLSARSGLTGGSPSTHAQL